MNLTQIAEVGGAGAAGAVVRYGLNRAILRSRPPNHPFPVGTVFINISGSLFLGLLTGLVLYHDASSTVTLVAGAGFCGGYTTFSAASFETVQLLAQQERTLATINVLLTLGASLLAGAAGLALASL